MIRYVMAITAVLAVGACTDVVSRGPDEIVVAVPSAYRVDVAQRRATRYCDDKGYGRAELVRTENMRKTSVVYFHCT